MTADLVAALPLVLLAGGAVVLAAIHRLAPADERATVLLGAIVAVAAGITASVAPVGALFGGVAAQDARGTALGVLICATVAFALLAERPQVLASPAPASTITALALVSAGGALVCAAAADLLTLFVGLQLVWIPLAVARAVESGRRVPRGPALVGVASAALFAVGAVFVFLALGTTRLGALAAAGDGPARFGLALVVAAVAQSATLAPFVLTGPGARAIASGHGALATSVPALAGFSALVRIGSLVTADQTGALDWSVTFAVVAAVTIVIATLAAAVERSARGLAAFGVTAQLGIAAGGLALGDGAFAGVFAMLASASIAAVGTSAALATLGGTDALRGLARARPATAAALGIVWLSAAGVPPLLGFAARLAIYEAAARAQLAWLVIVAALASAAWTVVALRLIVESLREGTRPVPRGDAASAATLLVCGALVVMLGLAPEILLGAGR